MLRASMPRFRIDQMMDLNWKVLTPLALVLLGVVALVDKLVVTLVPAAPNSAGTILVRVVLGLLCNLGVLWAADKILTRQIKSQPRPVVVDRRLPVARPPQSEVHN
jgi:NADH-quinone oxidoreductase subunit H